MFKIELLMPYEEEEDTMNTSVREKSLLTNNVENDDRISREEVDDVGCTLQQLHEDGDSMEVDTVDIRLKTPFRAIIAGPSECGKTTFVFNILRDQYNLVDVPTNNVIYFYNQWQSGFTMMHQENRVSEWVNAMPTIDMLKEKTEAYKDREGSIVVIDDFMQQINGDILDLFTILCHSHRISVFLLTQNVFPPNPSFRTISLNATYIVIFKNPRDASQIVHFAQQFAPGNSRWVVDAYHACTRAAYSYIMFNMHQTTDARLRVFSHYLPHERPVVVWMDKDESI